MRSFLSRILGAQHTSKDDAKQRLKVLLIHERIDLTPMQLDAMKREIMEVVQRYVEVDVEGMEFRLDRDDTGVSLVSNLPVRRVNARATAG